MRCKFCEDKKKAFVSVRCLPVLIKQAQAKAKLSEKNKLFRSIPIFVLPHISCGEKNK